MNVLSLFDGISCGRVALDRADVKYDNYYASEIDKYAIRTAQKNYPDTIQLGDVQNWREWKLPKIDMILAGSPCQGFSFAGKQLNFDDPRSKLFFDFVDILKHYKPKWFLLENVIMKKEYHQIISKYVGVEPIRINSALVSAQNRDRIYWTNLPNVGQPEDRGILLRDIVHENCDFKFNGIIPKFNKNPSGKGLGGIVIPETSLKSRTLTSNDKHETAFWLKEYIVPFDKTLKILDAEVKKGKVGYFHKDSQANIVYYIHDKAVTLCGEAGGGAAKMGQYLFGVINKARGNNTGGLRNDGSKSPAVSSSSWEHNNHLLFGCIAPDRVNKRQNGQRFNNGRKFYTLTGQDRHGILVEGYIRKLTPIECERLQTLPDNYTESISNSQRYKCLGNGWTVDVIAHIFKHINNPDYQEKTQMRLI